MAEILHKSLCLCAGQEGKIGAKQKRIRMRPKEVQEHTDAIRSALQEGPLFQVSSCQPDHSVLLYMSLLHVSMLCRSTAMQHYRQDQADVIGMAMQIGLQCNAIGMQ